jgi:3-phosphoshikimate 1-carboxyvinyltransferase
MSRKSPRRSAPAPALKGEIAAPGDKSLSHRALILSALAEGCSEVEGLLEGEDVLRTGAALRAFGAQIERDRMGARPVWRIEGAHWRTPETALYFGNSGTGARLMMGAVAGAGVAATFDGDASLRKRPMARILEPLALMGARIAAAGGRLPATVGGEGGLRAVDYALPHASAQVKSALLLAGLGATGTTTVREKAPTRDHTERMLPAFGVRIDARADGAGRIVRLDGGQPLKAARLAVPGDFSSAAFLIAAALIVPGSDIIVRTVGVNPFRTGLLVTLKEMGASIELLNARVLSGEQAADIRVRHSPLKGVRVPADRAPAMIDEYPILSTIAAFATGTTRMDGLAELRVKESDRLAAIAAGLSANGVSVSMGPDWLEITGNGGVAGDGLVETQMDHRIAMSFLILGLAARAPVEIDDDSLIATSFPGFFSALAALGAPV